MSIEIAYDTREAVPEAIATHVVERDGKFIFEAEPASALSDLNAKLKKLRGDLDTKTNKLGKFAKLEELGDEFDADELLSLREMKKQGKPLTTDEKAELERQHGKALKKYEDALKAREDGFNAAQAELKQFKLVTPLRDTALKAGVLAEDIDVVMLETQGRWKLGEDSKIVFLDSDGDEDATMTPAKFYGDAYKKLRPKFYAATMSGGSGAGNDTKGGKPGNLIRSKMSASEKSAFIKEHGQAKYLALPNE